MALCNYPDPVLEKLEMTETLKVYKSDLENAYRNKNDAFFPNHDKAHAALVLSTIFSNAKKSVYIYGKGLRQELSSLDVYFNSLKGCIERGVKIKVLLDADDTEKSDVRNWLENLNCKNVEVRSVSNVSEKIKQYFVDDSHFTVADGRMFRLEYDIENYKAFVGFHNRFTAKGLERVFRKVFNAA